MKKLYPWVAALTVAALAVSGFIPGAQAAVNVTAQPTSLVNSAVSLPASSQQTALFSFTISATSGETLASVAPQVDAANGSNITGSHIASLSLYQDNGSNSFNPVADNLVGSQTSVNIGSPTVITPAAATPATGTFYVSLATSGSWSSTSPTDSITVTLPSNGIMTSANSPVTSAVTTADINAQTSGPQLLSAVAQNTTGGTAKQAGDTVALTFSEATNQFAVTAANIGSQFTFNNSDSFLDGSGNIGGASWNASGTVLTITLSGSATTTPSLPTVALGDMITMSGSTGITDNLGSKATGQTAITGTFGSQFVPTVATAIYNPSEAVITTASSGAIVHDSATVSDSSSSTTPTGNVTFNFFDNGDCAAPAAATSSAYSLSGGYADATTFAQGPLATGSYSFMASYSGDSNYAAENSSCEPLTVSQNGAITISTQLSATAVATGTPVYDSATLTNFTANAGGTVTYSVYSGETCSATPVFTDTEPVSDGVVTVSKDFTPTSTGSYYWQAIYSGDANNTGVSSSCGSEVLTVTTTAPSGQICSNGITNGNIYKLQGSNQFYIGENCTLQPYQPQTGGGSGKGKGHSRNPFKFMFFGRGFGGFNIGNTGHSTNNGNSYTGGGQNQGNKNSGNSAYGNGNNSQGSGHSGSNSGTSSGNTNSRNNGNSFNFSGLFHNIFKGKGW